MDTNDEKNYFHIRNGGSGHHEQKRGLIAVWGNEAAQFLDGMITNDMKTLEDGKQMLAAFPNAQGRLLAIIRVLRQGDKYFIETEEETREKVFQNLFRFTFAGDFFVEDLSEKNKYYEIFGTVSDLGAIENGFSYTSDRSIGQFVGTGSSDAFLSHLLTAGAVEISDDLYETLRIEAGIPKYGIDMDETTIVPELGLDGMISYNKGCYIGQEIIARIHFRGHVAKRLTGLVSGSGAVDLLPGAELTNSDGKNAGRVTSVTFSPRMDKTIALAFVRYDYLAEGTELLCGEYPARVTALPFIT